MPREPLTPETLHEIGVRNKGNADVKALLWEIKRLRDELEQKEKEAGRDYRIITKYYQISRSFPDHAGPLKYVFENLKKDLEGHPARLYQDSIADIFKERGNDVKPGDDD